MSAFGLVSCLIVSKTVKAAEESRWTDKWLPKKNLVSDNDEPNPMFNTLMKMIVSSACHVIRVKVEVGCKFQRDVGQ